MDEQSIFLAALEIADFQARAIYLDQACANDPSLRKQVDALLDEHEQSDLFLDVPILKQMAHDRPLEATSGLRLEEQQDIELSFLEPSSVPNSLGRLKHYEIREMIGRGGCGIVLKAFDEKLERIVAIKVMAPELAATSPARQRFLREARATAAIRHDNVVNIYAVEEQPLPFLVMEYIDGETLQQRLDRTGPIEASEVLKIGLQIASGLAAAHAQGLIHRDIKPSNLLIEGGSDRLKITDFGLARSVDDASMTQSGVITGTPLYMSPEQAMGFKLDHRSDLFSLGSVLYAICSGRPPFRAASTVAVMIRVIEDEPRRIDDILSQVPQWLIAIIAKLHAKRPGDRFHTAQEVHDLLANCQSQLERQGHVKLPEEVLAMLMKRQPPPHKQTPKNCAPPSVSNRSLARPTRYQQAVAVVLLILLVSLGATEASGVTQVGSTVIQLFSPAGTLVVEVDDPAVSVTIDGEDLVITGAGAKEIRLKPGQYNVQASKDGKVIRQQLVRVTREGRQIVRVSAEPSIAAMSEPAANLASTEDAPIQYASDSGNWKTDDYANFATGKWVSLIQDKEEFERRVEELEAYGKTSKATFHDGGLDCHLTSFFFPAVSAKQFIFRVRVQYQGGPSHCGLIVEQPGPSYLCYWNCENGAGRFLGLGKTEDKKWKDLIAGTLPFRLPETFEFVVASIDHKITTYLEGKQFLEFDLPHDADEKFIPGVYAHRDGARAIFKDIEFMILPNDAARTSFPGKDNPDYLAAQYVRSRGGRVGLSGHEEEYGSTTILPSPPVKLKSVFFNQAIECTNEEFAVFADCQDIEALTLWAVPTISADGLKHFRRCRNLKVLALPHCDNIGSGLSHLSECDKVTNLMLWATPITREDFLAFADCKLQGVLLSYTPVKDEWLTHLTHPEAFTDLGFSFTQIGDEGLAAFQNSKKIVNLHLEHTKITDVGLAYFHDCRELKSIRLRQTSVTDAGVLPFKHCSKLEELSLATTNVTAAAVEELRAALPNCKITWDGDAKTESPEEKNSDNLAAKYVLSIGGIVRLNGGGTDIHSATELPPAPFRLTHVNFNLCKKATDDGLAVFANCKDIVSLTMRFTPNVTGRGLAYFKNCKDLKELNCNYSPYVSAGLPLLANCKNLEKISLMGVKFTREELRPIAELPLTFVNLGATPVQDEWLSDFTNAESLTYLNFASTKIGDKGLAAFQNCNALQQLSLQDTNITDEGLAYFYDCRDLEILQLQNTKVRDFGLLRFKSCQKLKQVEISKTRVTAAGVDELKKSLPYCTVVWDDVASK
ncbi:serine/threonine-protein kinase [Blastopirellula marina]|uniref:non-specific serine/threonine protein kinase n=1 Tax=Blastopirellula marina DSM 3645 TaxID=314230 RepID=A3ZQ01_9BACT|nr:serine/threonine-protein kinase [Blastopirellula marina]EAQ81274.1 serine/threonine protein kinase [Blastopirellula marina DSM 3645]